MEHEQAQEERKFINRTRHVRKRGEKDIVSKATKVHPNCRPRTHLGGTPYFAVYDFAVGCAKSRRGGARPNEPAKVRESFPMASRVVAAQCGMSRGAAQRGIDFLTDEGWLVLVKEGTREGEAARYRLVEHEEWVSKKGSGKCLRRQIYEGEDA